MELSNLAVPSVYALICFLAYSSQWLFLYLEPHPLTNGQLIRFNALLICLLISYTKSVFVDPGHIPVKNEKEIELGNGDEKGNANGKKIPQPRKWCRKCNAAKPPRAHHCRECKRCIPKMDHHCPWTSNCVSHTTFPHFLRFLFYAVISMLYLSSFLWTRLSHLYFSRDLPSYLGPSMFHIAHLFLLSVANVMMLFALSILLIRNIWGLAVNTTTIEGWEIERHATLVRRARYFGGFLEGPDGVQVQIKKQEFPYDIGIWVNFVQGMGTANVLAWFWPLAATPTVESGLQFETNGFEDEGASWPPPDPDRMHRTFGNRTNISAEEKEAFTYRDAQLSPEDTIEAFRKRQAEDAVRRRRPFVERIEEQQRKARERVEEWDAYSSNYADAGGEIEEEDAKASFKGDDANGEEAWRNSEGERLRDFGVDEDIEFYDEEDDIPLSELLARRRAIKGEDNVADRGL